MKIYISIPLAIVLSLISLYFYADYLEHGDTNAALMYIIVYSIPLIGVSIVNGILLKYFERKTKRIQVIYAAFIPLVSSIFLFTDDISLQFISTVVLISIGITNTFYLTSSLDDSN